MVILLDTVLYKDELITYKFGVVPSPKLLKALTILVLKWNPIVQKYVLA